MRESKEIETEMKVLCEKMVALENIISDQNIQIQELSKKMSCLENGMKETKDNDKLTNDKDGNIENTLDALNGFEKKLEMFDDKFEDFQKRMLIFAKHM